MLELRGKYNSAKVFTDNIEETATSQIIELCSNEFASESKIRIMPDTHAGAGCTIGTTMTIKDKVVPNLVGVDIGCGMETIKISNKNIDFNKLDEVIRKYIPSGFNIRDKAHKYSKDIPYENLRATRLDINRASKSIGTLGGGNHFVEMNEDNKGNVYLVIHSGSRNLGKQVAEEYQKIAVRELSNKDYLVKEVIDKLKSEGRQKEIQSEVANIEVPKFNPQLAYLKGTSFDNYINDMKIVQQFAVLNRKAMIDEIVNHMKFDIIEQFTTIHNYIDTNNMILRKGAISAQKGEKVIIPINMRDGSIIAVGKGNEDWNFSAPHGAGRLMSRSKAKDLVSIEEFRDTMKNVWTTSVTQSTLDESPFAYKPIQEIVDNVEDTVEILEIIKPLYNFKSN
jgi:tRNA-splicing ligase RtcB